MEQVVPEVIFEIRWGSQNPDVKGEIKNSPGYTILLGKFLETFKKDFTFLETLPSAGIPEGLSRGIVQYRLRKDGIEGWPLIQLGPGVFSFNINKDNWDEFKKLVIENAEKFAKISEDFKLEWVKIKLTYLLAKEFDFGKQDLSGFLKNNLGIELSMGKERKLDKMRSISFQSKIPTDNPSGDLIYILSEGKKKEANALAWQAQLESEFPQIIKEKELLIWLEAANLEIRKWVKL